MMYGEFVPIRSGPSRAWRDLQRDWQRWSAEERLTAIMLGAGVTIILPLFLIAFGMAFRL